MNSRSCITRSSLAWVSSGDVADLVEEQRALVRQLEQALLGVDRAGEGALHVAEEVATPAGRGAGCPEFTTMKGLSARGLLAWMALATSSLPVPLSPTTRMVERLRARPG